MEFGHCFGLYKMSPAQRNVYTIFMRGKINTWDFQTGWNNIMKEEKEG